mmetsp:Transcript_11940/g.31624  ORF Transcript_11940/g.31624 Transcript_11940/m.31624 type:complete len:127 (-) Transcript_11940:239-619(-)
METGRELSKTVATFIVQKLLLDEMGLAYICQTADRFYAVSSVLAKMVATLQQNPQPSIRLLRHVIRCYLRLADNARAREALRQCLPECLQAAADPQMHPEPVAACLGEDATAHRHLLQLLQALSLR